MSKEDCVNHVFRQLGTALRILKVYYNFQEGVKKRKAELRGLSKLKDADITRLTYTTLVSASGVALTQLLLR